MSVPQPTCLPHLQRAERIGRESKERAEKKRERLRERHHEAAVITDELRTELRSQFGVEVRDGRWSTPDQPTVTLSLSPADAKRLLKKIIDRERER